MKNILSRNGIRWLPAWLVAWTFLAPLGSLASVEIGFDDRGARVPIQQFDYDSVEPEPSAPPARMIPALAAFWRDVLEWASFGQRGQFRGSGMRQRITVAVWVCYPSVYKNVSQRQLAKRLRVRPRHVDEAVESFCKRFKVKKRRSGKAGRWGFVWGKAR
jgi:hypothetical protein